jgi:transposase
MNQLKVHRLEEIITLKAQGWSARRIARELDVDRETVGKYLRNGAAKPATPTLGSATGNELGTGVGPPDVESKPATLTLGSEDGVAEREVDRALAAARANVSLCEPWREVIEAGLKQRLSAKRIHQDLVSDYGFPGSYESVKRFTRRLEAKTEIPYRRMESLPGDEMQVDFGQGAWVVEPDGRKRRPHLFRAVLSHSRKGYTEVVWRQDTESFLRCIENAFRAVGGVTRTVVCDNLKAAVIHPDWYDPELNPKLAEFAKFYGTVVLPCKPGMPRHKGKCEAGVDYAQENAVKGRRFESLGAQNIYLAEWERNVADTRIHGTIHQQVRPFFMTAEQPALLPLPAGLFPSFTEGKRSVHGDGHVEFEKSFYSVPPEYVGREVWVRGDSRMIRLFNQRMEPIAAHVRGVNGRATTSDEHIHPLKRRLIDRGVRYLLSRCGEIGPACGAWAEAVHHHRPIEGVRAIQGLLPLAKKHTGEAMEKAAAKALCRSAWHLSAVKIALGEPENVVQVDFLETHPLIRSMTAYRVPFPP